MGATLFISDLHLSEETPAIEAGFFSFLERERDASALYLLGDIFEAWIGDDDDSPLAQRVISQLAAVSDRGTGLFLCRGNRDFMLGEQFAQAVGAELLPDQTVIDLAGQRTLLMHGDTLCTDDTDYQALRTVLHDPNWQRDMLQKPLAERRALAQQLRAMSQQAASNKAEDIMDVNEGAVSAAAASASVTRLIHGHTHRPARHDTSWGERIVLGDWTQQTGWCLRVLDDAVSLEDFAL